MAKQRSLYRYSKSFRGRLRECYVRYCLQRNESWIQNEAIVSYGNNNVTNEECNRLYVYKATALFDWLTKLFGYATQSRSSLHVLHNCLVVQFTNNHICIKHTYLRMRNAVDSHVFSAVVCHMFSSQTISGYLSFDCLRTKEDSMFKFEQKSRFKNISTCTISTTHKSITSTTAKWNHVEI